MYQPRRLHAELGGIGGLAGLSDRGIPGTRGAMDLDLYREALRSGTRSQMGTALTGDPRDVALRDALYSALPGS